MDKIPDLFQWSIDHLFEVLVVADLRTKRMRVYMQHYSSAGEQELVDLAVLLCKLRERLDGQARIKQRDVRQEGNSWRLRNGRERSHDLYEELEELSNELDLRRLSMGPYL